MNPLYESSGRLGMPMDLGSSPENRKGSAQMSEHRFPPGMLNRPVTKSAVSSLSVRVCLCTGAGGRCFDVSCAFALTNWVRAAVGFYQRPKIAFVRANDSLVEMYSTPAVVIHHTPGFNLEEFSMRRISLVQRLNVRPSG